MNARLAKLSRVVCLSSALLILGGCSADARESTHADAEDEQRSSERPSVTNPRDIDNVVEGQKPNPTNAGLVQTSTKGSDKRTDWPQFRGPGGLGVARATGLPTKWGPDENIVWKTPLPGAGTSSPVIIGDRIFLTCYRGYGAPGQPQGDLKDLTLDVVSLKRNTGEILWTKTVKPNLPEQPTIRD